MADLQSARELWGRTGDEAPSGPQRVALEATGLDEYLAAIEEQETPVMHIGGVHPRDAHLAALEAFAASTPPDTLNPATGSYTPTVAPGKVQQIDFSGLTSDKLDLTTWLITLGKFTWVLSPQEQVEIVAVLRRALRRHLEEEHKALIGSLIHAAEVVGVEEPAAGEEEVQEVRSSSFPAVVDVSEVSRPQPQENASVTKPRRGRP